jgi:hypothetical protein
MWSCTRLPAQPSYCWTFPSHPSSLALRALLIPLRGFPVPPAFPKGSLAHQYLSRNPRGPPASNSIHPLDRHRSWRPYGLSESAQYAVHSSDLTSQSVSVKLSNLMPHSPVSEGSTNRDRIYVSTVMDDGALSPSPASLPPMASPSLASTPTPKVPGASTPHMPPSIPPHICPRSRWFRLQAEAHLQAQISP